MTLFQTIRMLPILAAVLSTGCAEDRQSNRPSLVMLVAASTTDVMTEFAENYEKRTGVPVDVATGPSNGLARQILAGAPAEVYVSASPAWAKALADKKLVKRETTLFANRLVLVVPRGNPAGVNGITDLTNNEIDGVAIAGENVPAGEYAEAALRYHKMLEQLITDGKLVRGHDVRVTLGYVERREVAAGLVYATDAIVSKGVEVVAKIDPAAHPPIRYPAVLLEQASREGRAFYEALVAPSQENAKLFKTYGFYAVSGAKEAP